MGVVILSGRGDFCVGVSILIIRIFHLPEWAWGQRCSDNRGSTVQPQRGSRAARQ